MYIASFASLCKIDLSHIKELKVVFSQKLVSRHDSVEHSLFSQAREADSQRKKKSQLVVTLQSELDKLKQKNARKLKVIYTFEYLLYKLANKSNSNQISYARY